MIRLLLVEGQSLLVQSGALLDGDEALDAQRLAGLHERNSPFSDLALLGQDGLLRGHNFTGPIFQAVVRLSNALADLATVKLLNDGIHFMQLDNAVDEWY